MLYKDHVVYDKSSNSSNQASVYKAKLVSSGLSVVIKRFKSDKSMKTFFRELKIYQLIEQSRAEDSQN